MFNGVLNPNLLDNPLLFCSSINFDFLLLRTAYFKESIIVVFLVLGLLGPYFLYFFCTSTKMITLYNFNRFCTLLLGFRLYLSFCLSISSIPIFLPCCINLSVSISPSSLYFCSDDLFQLKIMLFLINQ